MPWKKLSGMPAQIRAIHEIDVEGKVLGRVATRVATLLIGKHKTGYVPYMDMGDVVIIKNVDKIVLTGKKEEQKVHYRTSNRPGGLKTSPISRLRKENPSEILKHAVKYMLPKNRTQSLRMKRLKFV